MLNIRYFALEPYQKIFDAMRQFTRDRNDTTEDELWVLEHPPVYTQGVAGKDEHILKKNSIPMIKSDRGGQITYHGPGQLVAYVLMNIKRKHIGIRTLVHQLESVLIEVLKTFNINGETQCGAPGVYIDNKKIASIGLRVKNGYTYHGIALNVDMDLTPFSNINPCGFEKLQMTDMKAFKSEVSMDEVKQRFIEVFRNTFGY